MDLRIKIKRCDGLEETMDVDTEERVFDINEILPIGTGIKSWYVVAV